MIEKISIFAADIDGTLVEKGGYLMPRTKANMQRLHEDIDAISSVAALFKANPNDMLMKVEQQAAELKEARRLFQQYKDKEEPRERAY